MFLSIEVAALLIVAVVNLAVFWTIASQGWRVVANRYFLLSIAFVLFWALGTALFLMAPTLQLATIGITTFYTAPMFTIMFLALFASVFLEKDTKRLWTPVNVLLVLVTIIGVAAILIPPAYLTERIQLATTGLNKLVVNPYWYSIYLAYFNFAFFVTFARLFKSIETHKGYQKQQLKYVFIGTFLSALFSLATNLIMPIFGMTGLIWLGPTWTMFYVVAVSISIVKHRLFDVRLAVVRSVAYVGSLLSLSAVYYLLAYLVSTLFLGGETSSSVSISPVNIFLALLLAFLFQPIKAFFDKITNRIFYRDKYDSGEFFARISEVLTTTTDLRGLLQRAASEISSTLKAEQAFFFVYYNHSHHVSAGTKHHSSMPEEDAHQLNSYVEAEGDGVIVTELLPENHPVRRLLESHKTAVLMPLMSAGTVVGYFALGEQLSSSYTNRDIRVLSTISDELVIAIQNSLSVQEVKDINVHLQQRIDFATHELRASNTQLRHLDTTKDEFLSMASHQLRTPLTSVKGYISMVLEGDAGKITEMQKHLLGEAFASSERMVHLIHDFLNVSRLQTGKFMLEQHPYDLAKLAKEEIDSLQHTAEARKMKLKFIDNTKLPPLNIDENKIRQVVMNFIDNALFYSHEDTTINIELSDKDGNVELRVKDTGIGVPKSEQGQLFNKFYRASNARKQRPDGTGVGLFLAKKVIVAHGGDVLFESTENKGSTFGFTLPVEKLSAQPDESPKEEPALVQK
ncbi:MAG: ATP-binding protein [Candidatus Saccharibacteria bacterium]